MKRTHDYCPYKAQPKPAPKPILPDSGMVIESGKWFTIALRSEVKALGIKLHKTSKTVIINGKIRPVWEKDNWDMCSLISELFKLTGIDCELADYLTEE